MMLFARAILPPADGPFDHACAKIRQNRMSQPPFSIETGAYTMQDFRTAACGAFGPDAADPRRPPRKPAPAPTDCRPCSRATHARTSQATECGTAGPRLTDGELSP